MEEAKALLDAGDLDGAVQSALNTVKSKPTDIPARIFLFELSCFTGDWERAERQLDTIGRQDVNAMVGSLIYRQCIEAERKRAKFFSESLKPEFLSDPPDYVYGLLTANNRLREGNTAEARQVLDTVEEQRPAFSCTVNGESKEDFRDYNDATSSILEVFIKDSYVWVPFEELEKLEVFAPKSLRDLFWLQGKIETSNGTNGEVMIPTLYSGSFKHSNDQVRLGRMTDWRDLGEEIFIGEGTKLFWMDGQDKPILDIKKIEFTVETE
jgi:type VI secretion system protein ImpE